MRRRLIIIRLLLFYIVLCVFAELLLASNRTPKCFPKIQLTATSKIAAFPSAGRAFLPAAVAIRTTSTRGRSYLPQILARSLPSFPTERVTKLLSIDTMVALHFFFFFLFFFLNNWNLLNYIIYFFKYRNLKVNHCYI